MAESERETLGRLAKQLRTALPAQRMPDASRLLWRERLVAAANQSQAQAAPSRAAGIAWQRWALAAALVIAVSAASTYGTFRWLSQRVVAAAWERHVVARTEELMRHPELWAQDPGVLARSLGVEQVHVANPHALRLTPSQLQRLGQGKATHGQVPAELLIPVGPAEVIVVQPSSDMQQLAGGMQHVFWLSAGVGLASLLLCGGWLWLRWRNSLKFGEVSP